MLQKCVLEEEERALHPERYSGDVLIARRSVTFVIIHGSQSIQPGPVCEEKLDFYS